MQPVPASTSTAPPQQTARSSNFGRGATAIINNGPFKRHRTELRKECGSGVSVAALINCLMHLAQHSLRKIAFGVCLLLSLAATPETLTLRIEKARAEKKIDGRLNALGNLGKNLSLAEIPAALKAVDDLDSLRERVALKDTVLKRWGELAPAESFAYIAAL